MKQSFLELFDSCKFAKTPALVCGKTVITYTELHRRSSALAARLRSWGVGMEPTSPDSYDIFAPKAARHSPWVVIISNRSADAVIGVIATLMAGGAFVLVDADASHEYTQDLIDDTAPSAVLRDSDFDESDKPNTSDATFTYDFPRPCDIACAIFTSGSTGKPKGAVLEHRVINEMLEWQNAYMRPDGWQATAMYSPFGFIASIWEIFFPLANGLALHILDEHMRHDLFSLADYIEKNNISYMFLPPNVAEIFTKTYRGNALKYLRVAGGRLHSCGDPSGKYEILYSLGMSENGGSVTFNRICEGKSGEISIGKPWNNTRVYLTGDEGEMAVSGPSLFRGYLARREETESKLIKNPYSCEPGYELLYLSGDLAEMNGDGELLHRGRNDWIVKIRDMKVDLMRVEDLLHRCGGVDECCVTVRDNSLAAWFAGSTGVENLKAELLTHLPEYMVPSLFVKLDRLPRNINGKVDRNALVYAPAASTTVSDMKETEMKFAKLFEDILGLPPHSVSAEDSFFRLGGDSLKLIRLQVETELAFEAGISYAALLDNPSPRKMAQLLSFSDRLPPILPAPRREMYPLSAPMRQMWLLWRTGQDRGRYTVSVKCRVAAQPDMQRLLSAFEELIRRNAILRSRFAEINGNVFQVIEDNVPVVLSKAPRREFDLAFAPLFDITFEQGILTFTTHHIIADATGLRILIEDLWTLYDGGEPQPSAQVHDVAVFSEGHKKTADESFWQYMFRDGMTPPELPYDFPRPSQLCISAVETVSFDESETSQLSAYASSHNATLFQLFLTAYARLLSVLSGSGSVIVGVPFAGRDHPDISRTIGMFVRTLPVKLELSEMPFGDALIAVRERFAQVWEHQDTSVEDLTKIVNVPRKASHNPFYDVMINLVPLPRPLQDVCDLHPEIVRGGYHGALVDLVLDLREEINGVSAVFTYAAELFKPETTMRFAKAFRAMLLEPCAHPSFDTSGKRLQWAPQTSTAQAACFDSNSPHCQSLIQVWKYLLQCTSAAPEDDFIALGGTSLLAIRMEAAMFEAGWLLSAADIFQNPRLGDMAALITAADDIDWEEDLCTDSV